MTWVLRFNDLSNFDNLINKRIHMRVNSKTTPRYFFRGLLSFLGDLMTP